MLSPLCGQDYCLCYLSSACGLAWLGSLRQAWQEEQELEEAEGVLVGCSQKQQQQGVQGEYPAELLESQGRQEPHQARAGPAERWGEIIYL